MNEDGRRDKFLKIAEREEERREEMIQDSMKKNRVPSWARTRAMEG